MALDRLKRNRHLAIPFLWILVSVFLAMGAVNGSGQWRFAPPLAFLLLAVANYLLWKPRIAPVGAKE